ncbi:spastic paraplegia 11 (autosomal recessive) [Chamberlinius hualienensis]
MSENFGLKTIAACTTLRQNIEEVEQVKVSADLKSLAILTKDGSLRIVCLHLQRSLLIKQNQTKSFLWHACQDYNKLVTLDDDKVSFYSINPSHQFNINDVKCCESVDTIGELDRLIGESGYQDDDNHVYLLGYRNETATFFYKNHIAYLRCESGEKLQWEIVIKVTAKRSRIVSQDGVQVVLPFVFVFGSDGIIDVYDLASRTLKIAIDLNEYSQAPNCAFSSHFSSLSRYSVATNLDYLVHVDHEGRAFYYSLKHLLSQMQIDSLYTSKDSLLKKSLKNPQTGFFGSIDREHFSQVKYLHYESRFLKEFKATPAHILFWEFNQECNGKLEVIDAKTRLRYASFCLKEPSFVIFSQNSHSSHLIMTCGKLSVMIYNVPTQELLSQLIIKESTSAVAAHLSALNDWKSVFICPQVLERCLQNRQIEAVIFYLNSHEFDYTVVEKFSSSEIEHLQTMLKLLQSSINESVTDPSLGPYVEKLLSILLGYLIRFLKTALSASNDKILNLVMDNLNDLKRLMEKYPKLASLRADCDQDSKDATDVWKDWLHLDKLNIIRSGLQNKCLPLVQIFFLHNSYENFNFSVHESSLSGLEPVINHLSKNEVEKSIEVLKSMDLDVTAKLKHIYFNTANRNALKAIEDYFNGQEWLTEEDKQLIKRFHDLEETYPCQSITDTLSMIKNLKLWGSNDLLGVSPLFGSPDSRSNLNQIDEKRDQSVETEIVNNFNYNCTSIRWISHWDDNTWKKVMLEALVLKPDFKYSELIDSQLTWNYLIDHNRIDIISNWLSSILEPNSLVESKIGCFLGGKCTKEMIAGISKLVPNSAAHILDQLSRYGVFSEYELASFPLLLKRLGRVVSDGIPLVDILSGSNDLSLETFHKRFIKYCATHDFPGVLWNHLETFGLATTCLLQEDSSNSKSACNWLSVLANFKNWSENPKDMKCLHAASLANAKFKMQTMLHTQDINKCGLIRLATLLYDSDPVRPMILESDLLSLTCELHSSSYFVKDDLHFVFDVLSSFINEQPKVITDVTVYSLLQGNWPFDVSQLFGWQKLNILKAPNCFKDLPSFSDVEMVRNCGLSQELDYTFYIHQARPAFAYVKFVVSNIPTNGNMKQSIIDEACNVAHCIAIENFFSETLAASAVAFMELLCCNTQGLRIDLEILQLIHRQQLQRMSKTSTEDRVHNDDIGQDTEIEKLLKIGFYNHEANLNLILNWAEKSMIEYLSTTQVDEMKEFEHWSVLNLFCQRHGLPYSSIFPEKCLVSGNWMMFISFTEIFFYSRIQVGQLITEHKSNELAQHLKHALHQVRYYTPTNLLQKAYSPAPSNSKVDEFSQMWFNFEISDEGALVTHNGVKPFGKESHIEPKESASLFKLNDVNQCNEPTPVTPNDILETLLEVHKLTEPHENLLSRALELSNPTLVIFAACYRESSVLDCIAVWFLINIGDEGQKGFKSKFGDRSLIKGWNLHNLVEVVKLLIEAELFSMLVLGFYYFMLESPCYFLFKFIKHFLEDKCYDSSVVYLKEFEANLHQIQNKDSFGPGIFFEEFCVATINHVLLHIHNQHERTLFLSALSKINIEDTLRRKGARTPRYSLLYSFEKLLSKTSVKYNVLTMLNAESIGSYPQDFRSILNSLMKEQHFEIADQLAKLIEYPKHEVLLLKADMEIASKIQFGQTYELNAKLFFWKQYYLQFKESEVPAKEACLFLKKYGLLAKDLREQYYVFYLAWLTFTWSERNPWFDGEIEKEMWLARIKAEAESEVSLDLPESLFDFVQGNKCQLKTSHEVFVKSHANPIANTLVLASEKEKNTLEKIIRYELDQGNVDVVYRLTLLFNIPNSSLSIILTCMQLAEGAITEDQIDSDLLVLVNEHKARKTKLTFSRSSSLSHEISPRRSSLSENVAKIALHHQLSLEQSDVVILMNGFKTVCTVGLPLVSKIITFYKVSLVLKRQYECVILSDPTSLLADLLDSDCARSVVLVKDLVLALGVDDNVVASLLSRLIMQVLQTSSDSASIDQSYQCGKDAGGSLTDSSSAVLQLASILDDPSILGKCLLDRINSHSNGNGKLSVDVELCICSHNCYTLACHVGGITATLQMAKDLSQQLTSAGEYSLMMRLLIGMGRFSEMSYIFDILKSHKVKLLIKEGLEKVPGYKLALLDYMKRFHSNDTDSFTMIALHFRMYREIAETLEKMAKSFLTDLKWDIAGKLIGSAKPLEIIMQAFRDAAESYVKSECFKHGLVCAKQAELVALQMYLHQFGTKVIELSKQEVSNFIANNTHFFESYIVAEAYEHHQDWASAIYNNYVFKSEEKYLPDFCSKIQLSVSILENIIRRYIKEPAKTDKTDAAIRHLLNLMDDVKLKYDLATELGFTDIIEKMIADQGYLFLQRADLSF